MRDNVLFWSRVSEQAGSVTGQLRQQHKEEWADAEQSHNTGNIWCQIDSDVGVSKMSSTFKYAFIRLKLQVFVKVSLLMVIKQLSSLF